MTLPNIPRGEPIAIVGSGCRFAGEAHSPSDLWRLLADPPDLTQDIPADRFNIKGFFHPDGEYNGTTNSPKAYFLNQNHKVFDTTFFNILPKEAEAIDPQQRMLLEVVYEAMEDAGFSLHDYSGRNVAVYAGIMTADYDTVSQRDDLNTSQYYATGNARSIVANRISYFFNFGGPSMTIDTACSSSLVALDQAVNNLRAGKCEMACVTGANLILTPEQFIAESSLHMLSPTGHCRMWDSKADGYARGEGVSAVLIKSLSKAIADGDRIQGIIREIGVNSDGRTKGITMPSWAAQASLIRDTYERAGLDPTKALDRCQFFEAHGTGTAAGDPNEARAIQEAFFGLDDDDLGSAPQSPVTGVPTIGGVPTIRVTRVRKPVAEEDRLLVGSIKTVVGHTEGAAGLAGLIKVVQAIRHSLVPPNLHLDELSPAVAAVSPDLKVVTKLRDWPDVAVGHPKRASVNSFGFGGTNSHIIVEEYLPAFHDKIAPVFNTPLPPPEPEAKDDQAHLTHDVTGTIVLPLTISGNTRSALAQVGKVYRRHIAANQYQETLNQVAWHTYGRRTAFPYRSCVVGDVPVLLVEKLDTMVREAEEVGTGGGHLVARTKGDEVKPRILGIFTGQGAQWAEMSSKLLATSKTYAKTIRFMDECLQALGADKPSWSLEQEIKAEKSVSRVTQAEVAQPLCTAVQIGLVALFKTVGIEFTAVVGHSSGEIAAAYAAGRLSLRDAIVISYYRGKTAHLAQGPGGEKGGMAVGGMSEDEAYEWCSRAKYGGAVTVAAINSGSSITFSGNADAIEAIVADFKEAGVWTKRVGVEVAYHSQHMVPAANAYADILARANIVPLTPAESSKVPGWASSVVETSVPGDDELKGKYWVDNMVQPVRFVHAVSQAVAEFGPFNCAVEIGPHPAMSNAVTSFLVGADLQPLPYTGVLIRGKDDRFAVAEFLGWMWVHFSAAQPYIRNYVKDSSQPELLDTRLKRPPMYPWEHGTAYSRESRVCRQYHFRSDPPHELLGVRTRDDDEFLLRWRNVLKIDQLPWGTGHTFENVHLVPGSGYLSMAYDAAKFYLALSGRTASVIELVDLHFYSGITLDAKLAGVETLFSLTIDEAPKSLGRKAPAVIEGSFTLTSCPADGTTDMKKNFGGRLRIRLGDPSLHALPARIKEDDAPETAHADPAAFYKMMEKTGLAYSGPFQGLTSLQKRTNFASGTVQQLHAEDTTTLTVSPATLDSCLQTAFVTVSSPGDKSLWTAFLPQTIDCIRFNVASCEGKIDSDLLNIDAYLTDAKSFSSEAAASFTADIEIFGQQDRLQMQVQGLTVASFSTTKAENDVELYLTTVLDVDPDVEIVTPKRPVLVGGEVPDDAASPALVESCERVATFYANNQTRKGVKLPPKFTLSVPLPVNGWPDDTQETIDAFISNSPFFITLDFVRRVGKKVPNTIYGMLPDIIVEAQNLLRLQDHVSRVVRQIAHKYPRMHIFGYTDEDYALTEPILNGLGDAFLTYRVAGDADKNLAERVLTTPARKKKVIVKPFDPAPPPGEEEAADTLYDLVIVSSAMILYEEAGEVARKEALEAIQRKMRPGGFLVMVDSSEDPLWQRLEQCVAPVDESVVEESTVPVDWSTLLDEGEFMDDLHGSTQPFQPNYSIMVRQARSAEKHSFRFPFESIGNSDQLAPRLLVVGGNQAWTGSIKNGLSQELGPHCGGNVTIADGLDRINKDTLDSFPVVIFLADIDSPILKAMTAARMDTMRALLSPGRRIVWVTFNSRFHNPDNAASLGFVRTLLAETPGLQIQVLDLTSVNATPAIQRIKDTFARLVLPSPDEGKMDDEKLLFINELEVYIKDDRPLVARCLPWKDGNKRNNAPRRIVTNDLNSLEQPIQLSYVLKEYGFTGYEVGVNAEDNDKLELDIKDPKPETGTVRVEYSTADALKLGDKTAYVWLGRDLATDDVHVGLSSSNASYLFAPSIAVSNSNLPLAQVNHPLFVALLARYLSAITLAASLGGKSAVLVEPDDLLLDCVQIVFALRNIEFLVFSTDVSRCNLNPNITFVHAHASEREIKALYPPATRFQIVDMLPEGSEISRVLRYNLPKRSEYDVGSYLLAQEDEQVDASGFSSAVWDEAVGFAVAAVQSHNKSAPNPVKSHLVTAPALAKTSGQLPPFRIIDWKADRSVPQAVRYFPKPKLSANKVYILVGITRDFGQSLCHLFAAQGARHIILCSRSPPADGTKWQRALRARGVNIEFQALDVTSSHQVIKFKQNIENTRRLVVGGVVNGAMVLEDKVFTEMSVETLHRVMLPKTDGSRNLSNAFPGNLNDDLEFFIMTSSFAAIGGHAGQSNYAAANMYMNGLAAKRRRDNGPGSVLNIGVIYGIGFLHREKSGLYEGLEREGYPPISERDIHHMFIEAIDAGKGDPKPPAKPRKEDVVYDIVTGLARYPAHEAKLYWQQDPRFSHYTQPEEDASAAVVGTGGKKKTVRESVDEAKTVDDMLNVLLPAFLEVLGTLLGVNPATVNADASISSDLGVDSLVAVEIRQWFYRTLGTDVAVMKVLSSPSIRRLCFDTVTKLFEARDVSVVPPAASGGGGP